MGKHRVDMTDVQSYSLCEEGLHLAKIVSFEEKTASTGTEMESGCFEVVRGTSSGARVYENFPLTQKALFKVQKLLQALGLPHEGSKVVFDTDKLVGKTLAIQVSHYEYDGSTRSRIDEFYPAAAVSGAKGTKKASSQDDDEDEDETPYDGLSAKALFAMCQERGIKVKSKQEASLYIEKLLEWDTANDEDEDDDDDWADDDE